MVHLQDDNSTLEVEAKFIALVNLASEKMDFRNTTDFAEKEDMSLKDWVKMWGLWDHPHVQSLASMLKTSIVGRELDEVGAHYFLDYIKSGLGLESLLTEGQNGAQSLMIEECMYMNSSIRICAIV